jgi:DnaJ-class molecular chaperone
VLAVSPLGISVRRKVSYAAGAMARVTDTRDCTRCNGQGHRHQGLHTMQWPGSQTPGTAHAAMARDTDTRDCTRCNGQGHTPGTAHAALARDTHQGLHTMQWPGSQTPGTAHAAMVRDTDTRDCTRCNGQGHRHQGLHTMQWPGSQTPGTAHAPLFIWPTSQCSTAQPTQRHHQACAVLHT